LSVLPVGISGEAGAYQIERSLRFNSADSASLSRTPASASNRKTWTWSGWVKRCEISDTERVFFSAGTDGNNFTALEWIDSKLYLQNYTSGTQTITNTTAVYRDASAWYHIVLAIDTTQATAANRAKIYVNGVQQAGFSGTPFSQDQQFWINYTYTHRIGARQLSSPDAYSSQYMAEVHFIDGSALTPSSFGETDTDTGVWKPKAYSGSYGTNGFYLDFADNSSTTALGYDAAGSNDWTPNNFSVTAGAGNDSLVDSPTRYGTDTGVGGEVRGNYATLNPLDNGGLTLTNGNLNSTKSGTSWLLCRATQGVSSGKWYFEGTFTQGSTSNATQIGICRSTSSLSNFVGAGADAYSYGDGAYKYNSGTGVSYGATYTTNDVIGVAFDLDAGTITFYKNGSSQGQAYSGLSGTFFPAVDNYNGSAWVLNFGQRPFAYTAPSGFKALCTTNLPEPTVANGGEYFNAVLYTGNGGTQSVTGVGFQPDFTWIKSRSGAYNNWLEDAVRGAGYSLSSNTTGAEDNYTTLFTSFASDGFNFAVGSNGFNASGQTYVAWNWKANGAGVLNEVGTIDSTVSANTTAGFSIVTYTGTGSNATVGHGLGVAPAMIIVKNRGTTTDWAVYHKSLTSAAYWLELNSTGGVSGPNSVVFNSTAPTSTVFSVGTNDRTNATNSYVAYCFAEVAGYSAFGKYTGNGSSDGVFVFLGFRARYLLIKRTDSTAGWVILDTARDTYNVTQYALQANQSFSEGTLGAYPTDIVSNGFKIRNDFGDFNASGGTFIYAAFAENPFSISLAR
jgi:hypothetical protein